MDKTVVAIEDDPQIAELIKLMLAAEEVRVHHYSDGAEGLVGVLEHKPDLVLLDIMIPGMTGWEVHQKIRENETTKDTPIMILSVTQQSFEQRMTFKQSKIDFYMAKPFEILHLREKINEILKVEHWQVDGTLPDTVPAARTQIKPIRDLLLAAQKVEEAKRKQREADANMNPSDLPKTGILRPLPQAGVVRPSTKTGTLNPKPLNSLLNKETENNEAAKTEAPDTTKLDPPSQSPKA